MAKQITDTIHIARQVGMIEDDIMNAIEEVTKAFEEIEKNYNCGFIHKSERMWQKVDVIRINNDKINKVLNDITNKK
jgi:hypothetical protein